MAQQKRAPQWWIAVAGLVGMAGLLAWRERPAVLQNIELTGIGAGPEQTFALARLRWHYSGGARPISLVIDLEGPGRVRGSLTSNGDESEGAIPLTQSFAGSYRLIATAVYRIAGMAQTRVYRFQGQIR